MTDIDEFLELLKRKSRSYSEMAASHASFEIGLRVLYLDGSFLRYLLQKDRTGEFIDFMFANCPQDACVIDHDGQLIRCAFRLGPGGEEMWEDNWMLMLGSENWQAIPKGTRIACLIFEIEKEKFRFSGTVHYRSSRSNGYEVMVDEFEPNPNI